MDSIFQHLVLGAFLHDIGKVMQRAEVPVSSGTEAFMATAGPSRNGFSTYFHVQWTSQFFEEHFLNTGIPSADNGDDDAHHLAFRHHNPATPLQEIVTQADHISSGMDRGESLYERDVHKRKRMVPIRTLLSMEGTPHEPYPRLPLTKLTSQDDSIYPVLGEDENESRVPEYQKLWQGFLQDWAERQAQGFEATLAWLDALYERYFWSIPASSIDTIPDSSLYDHSRTTAAVAGVLYLYHQQMGSLDASAIRDRQAKKFLLVSGDLSGIQNYIFAIAHSRGKVAKRLRARSFILSLLSQILARQILQDIGLPFLNLIMSAGGKFYLLLPNTNETRSILQRREQSSQQWLRDTFQGILSVNLSSVELSTHDFLAKRVGEAFGELATRLARRKHQPLRSLLQSDSGWNTECFIMPESMIQEESPLGVYDMEGLGEDEEHIGRDLTRARCLALYDSNRGRYGLLGWSFTIAPSAQDLDPKPLVILSYERGAERDARFASVPVHYEYRAAHVPIYHAGDYEEIDAHVGGHPEEGYQEGQILPFNLIAKAAQGRESLAYLKADMDNLGLLLRQGLEWQGGWTLSKLATLSRSLEFFFAGRLSHILRQSYPLIYTVFTGGDDLLLVGPWNQIHDFARDLRREWTRFTGENPYLTLSVGVSLARPMSPVGFAAGAAEQALEKAKRSTDHATPKNRLCAFDHVMKWSEVDAVFQEIKTLSTWLESKKISVSFVRSLLYFAFLADQYRRDKRVEGLRYLPLLSYTLSRNYKNDVALCQWCEKYKEAGGEAIRHLRFIATYVLNLNRGS